jgi:hypothetical protein
VSVNEKRDEMDGKKSQQNEEGLSARARARVRVKVCMVRAAWACVVMSRESCIVP